ncbi:hypothetical protein ACRRTK_017980 [Alexandromys fortis]
MVQSDASKSPPIAAVAQESQMELLESAAPAGALGAQWEGARTTCCSAPASPGPRRSPVRAPAREKHMESYGPGERTGPAQDRESWRAGNGFRTLQRRFRLPLVVSSSCWAGRWDAVQGRGPQETSSPKSCLLILLSCELEPCENQLYFPFPEEAISATSHLVKDLRTYTAKSP